MPVAEFRVVGHVRGRTKEVTGTESGGRWTLVLDGQQDSKPSLNAAIARAIEFVRDDWQQRLNDPNTQPWGIRIITACGTFQFGDWSFDPLTGGGGAPPKEGIFELFHKLQERSGPQAALQGTRELLRYCLGR